MIAVKVNQLSDVTSMTSCIKRILCAQVRETVECMEGGHLLSTPPPLSTRLEERDKFIVPTRDRVLRINVMLPSISISPCNVPLGTISLNSC